MPLSSTMEPIYTPRPRSKERGLKDLIQMEWDIIDEYNISPFDAYYASTAILLDKTILSTDHVYDKIRGVTYEGFSISHPSSSFLSSYISLTFSNSLRASSQNPSS